MAGFSLAKAEFVDELWGKNKSEMAAQREEFIMDKKNMIDSNKLQNV